MWSRLLAFSCQVQEKISSSLSQNPAAFLDLKIESLKRGMRIFSGKIRIHSPSTPATSEWLWSVSQTKSFPRLQGIFPSWFIHTYTTFAENQKFNPTLPSYSMAVFLLMSYGEKHRVAFPSDKARNPNLLWASSSTTMQMLSKTYNAQLVYIFNWEELAKK